LDITLKKKTPEVAEEKKTAEVISKPEKIIHTLFDEPITSREKEKEVVVDTNNFLNETFLVVKTEQSINDKTEPISEPETEKNSVPLHTRERINRLKELSMKIKTQQGVSELEKEPAYKRKNIELSNVPLSNESQISKFTLTEGDDKKVELKPNNSFLHDNVD